MIPKIDPKITLAVLLSKSATEVTVGQSILSILVALGFLFLDGTNPNYTLLYSFAHPHVWAAIFAVHGIAKILSVVAVLPRFLVLLNEILGIWTWSYILLSFTIFDSTPSAPTEILAVFPIMLEFWTLLDNPISRKRGEQK
jgi:hypothetical protein